jgi:hypothetical protein
MHWSERHCESTGMGVGISATWQRVIFAVGRTGKIALPRRDLLSTLALDRDAGRRDE